MSFIWNLLGIGGTTASQSTASPELPSDTIQDLTAKIERINKGIQEGKRPNPNVANKLLVEYDKIENALEHLKQQAAILKDLVNPLLSSRQSNGAQRSTSKAKKEALAANLREKYQNAIHELLKKPLDSDAAKRASALLTEIHKFEAPSEALRQASSELQDQLDSFYVDAIEVILAPLRKVNQKNERGGYALGRLGREGMPTMPAAVQLLIEVQANSLGNRKFMHWRNELERIVDRYVTLKFKNSQDENQLKSSVELLSFSRKLNRGVPMPFERALFQFVNAYAIQNLTAKIERINRGIQEGKRLKPNVANKLLVAYDKIQNAPEHLKQQVAILKDLTNPLLSSRQSSDAQRSTVKGSKPSKFLHLTVANVYKFCGQIGEEMTPSQIAQAKYFLREYKKIKQTSAGAELKEAVGVLQSLMPLSKAKKEALAANLREKYQNAIRELLKNPLDSDAAKRARALLTQIHKFEAPSEALRQASTALQDQLDSFYVDAIEAILDPLRTVNQKNERRYALGRLGQEGMPTMLAAVQLLIDLQANSLGNRKFMHSRNELERVVDQYVKLKFKNSQDENQVRSAVELLSFSRMLNRGFPMPFERALLQFINAHVEEKYSKPWLLNETEASKAATFLSLLENTNKAASQQGYEPTPGEQRIRAFLNAYAKKRRASFPNYSELALAPVGIPNEDGASCFAAAWMQLVANNRMLSFIYKKSFAKGDPARDVLDEYQVAQRKKATPENIQLLKEIAPDQREEVEDLLSLQPRNIVRMREILEGAEGQQDANDLASALHNLIEIAADGKINGRKFGAKIIAQGTTLATGEIKQRPYSANKATHYIFPSLDLNFNREDLSPSLSSMMIGTHVDQINDQRTHKTSLHFAEVPNVFIYRFTRLEGAHVNRTEVDMPLYHQIKDTSGRTGVLQLQGFIRHSGGAHGGHYVSYIAENGKFWRINDKRTFEISAADYLIAARHATTAVYSRVG